jgi:DNA-binding CsgD family transcriptional regulator
MGKHINKLTPTQRAEALNLLDTKWIALLSKRQAECLRGQINGMSRRDIGAALGIDATTVKGHLAAARKVIVASETERMAAIQRLEREQAQDAKYDYMRPDKLDFDDPNAEWRERTDLPF